MGARSLGAAALAQALLCGCVSVATETATAGATIESSRAADRAALRELFDRFAILADANDVEGQMELFADGAVVTSRMNGTETSRLSGKPDIAAAFSGFLAQFDTVFHQNGQHVVEVDGDRATGTGYATVVLVGGAEDERRRTTMGVIYADRYAKADGVWRIAERVSDFVWTEVEPAS